MNALFEDQVLSNGQAIKVLRARAKPRLSVVKAETTETESASLSEAVHVSQCFGRSTIWHLSNCDRYGNESGWPNSVAGRMDEAIIAQAAFGSKLQEGHRKDALDAERARQGMPELEFLCWFSKYVFIKGRRKDGNWYKIPDKTKANDLGIGLTEFHKRTHGALLYISGRLYAVREREVCAQNRE